MAERYASPQKHDSRYHDYSRVVDVSRRGKPRVAPLPRISESSSSKRPASSHAASRRESSLPIAKRRTGFVGRVVGALTGKRPIVASSRKAPAQSPICRAEPKKAGNSALRAVVASASAKVKRTEVGNAHFLVSRNPKALVDRTIRDISDAGVEVYPMPVGKGSYGTVFEGELKSASDFASLARSGKFVHRTGSISTVGKNDDLAIKIQVVHRASQIQELERESRVHMYVTKKARSIAPVFHVAGFMPDNWTYVTITSLVAGRSLCPLVDKKFTAAGFLKVERAIQTLWGIGVLHCDLHCNNIMVDENGNVKIIDFGRSIILPPDLRPKKVRDALDNEYQTRLQEFANDVLRNRVIGGNGNYGVVNKTSPGGWKVMSDKFQYSDNVQALRVLWKKLPESERRRFKAPVARA